MVLKVGQFLLALVDRVRVSDKEATIKFKLRVSVLLHQQGSHDFVSYPCVGHETKVRLNLNIPDG